MTKADVKSLKLTYTEGVFLASTLIEALLHGSISRSRNKIVDLLKKPLADFEKEKMELIGKYASKDEAGNPKVSEDGKMYVIKTESQTGFNKEYDNLVSTSGFIFDLLPSTEKDWITIAKVVLNSQKDLNYTDGVIYASLCEKLEKI